MCMPVWLHAIYWQGWCIFKCETTKRNYLKTYRKALLSKNLFIWCNILSNTCVIYVFENFLCSSPKTIFSRDTNIIPRMEWTSNIFGPSATFNRGFWVSLKYPFLQENGMPKKCLDAALCWFLHLGTL